MDIKISTELTTLCPTAALLILTYEVDVQKSSKLFTAYLNEKVNELHAQYSLPDIAKLPQIKDTREAYKKLGKSPSDYRNAAESMLRRIVKGNGLYHINNVVDINNYISISTGFSIGSYNCSQLSGIIEWKPAPLGETYQGIGKDFLNIEKLPTLYDNDGAFGNPTSDSRRAMIALGKQKVMSVIYSFSGEQELSLIADQYEKLLVTYADVQTVSKNIISAQ